MKTLKEELEQALQAAVATLAPELVAGGELPMDRCTFGPTKDPEHGDQATNAAMILCKPLKRKPRELGEELAAALEEHELVAAAEVAGPGFVNLHLAPAAYAQILGRIAEQAATFGHRDVGNGARLLLEFVSANPTGPMHLGHCRHAATGDVLARILAAANFQVTKEFYINDAGAQVKALGTSFHYRCLEALGALKDEDLSKDEEGAQLFRGEKLQYAGDYLADFAKDFVQGKTAADIEAIGQDALAWEARNRNLEMIKADLAALGVVFDNYVSEKAIHDGGTVQKTVERLSMSGKTYPSEGALFLRTEEYGDDKDRVLIKGDGTFTYIVPDIAYHADKFDRGFDHYINLFGADHGGYPPRLRAGIAILGYDPKKLEILLMRLVFLLRGGERVKFSKRAGNFVALADVVEEVGPAATRWFMLNRSIDSELEFDIDLATDHSARNPVYKVLYAHARICTMRDKGAEQGIAQAEDSAAAAAELTHPLEKETLLYLAEFPHIVERAARERAPHHLPAYLLGLAELWNRYYSLARTDSSFRILEDANKPRQVARLRFADAVRQVLANGLALLGIQAPERLTREEEE